MKPAALGDEFYTEQWSLSSWSDDGYYYHAQFVVSNFGVGDNKAAVKIETTLPDGSRKSYKEELEGYRYGKTGDGERISFKQGFLSRKGSAVEFSFGVKDARVNVLVESKFPVYRPHGTAVWYTSSDGMYDLELLVPRGTVTGEATVAGATRKVKGWGLVDHSIASMAPYNLARHWLKVKYVTAAKSVLVWGFAIPGGSGDIDRGFVWYGGNGKNFIANPRPAIVYSHLKKRDTSGYALPDHIAVSADGKAYTLNITLQAGKLKRSKDVLKDIGSLAGFMVRRFMNPWDYTMQGAIDIRLTLKASGKTTETTGQWDYVMQYITGASR